MDPGASARKRKPSGAGGGDVNLPLTAGSEAEGAASSRSFRRPQGAAGADAATPAKAGKDGFSQGDSRRWSVTFVHSIGGY